MGFSSNKGAYRIIERRLLEFPVDGDFQFDRKTGAYRIVERRIRER